MPSHTHTHTSTNRVHTVWEQRKKGQLMSRLNTLKRALVLFVPHLCASRYHLGHTPSQSVSESIEIGSAEVFASLAAHVYYVLIVLEKFQLMCPGRIGTGEVEMPVSNCMIAM